jgi:hypothetical protein
MPWNQSEWIRACNPVKLKEYLAVGRPVVSTDFTELREYAGLVRRASGAAEFAEQIRQALIERCDVQAQRARVARETWARKHEQVMQRLSQLGAMPRNSSTAIGQGDLVGASHF